MVDVARAAGVSRAAVSKVIRHAYGVSPAMRDRVEGAIRELGYRPSLAARAIRGTSFAIGFQLYELENPTLARILAGAARGVEDTGYRLVVAPAASADLRAGDDALDALVDLQVDGIVAVAPMTPAARLADLGDRIPLVMVARHGDAEAYDTVTGDDRAGTTLVLEHLLALGHRRIAHLTLPEDATDPVHGTPQSVRLRTYLDLLAARGLPADVRRTTGHGDDAYRVAGSLLDGPEPPTAVLAASDQLALETLRAVADRGLGPADVSVAGYDDVPVAAHPRLSLTSVDQPADELGRLAVELLLERIAGRVEARHAWTAPRLHVRTSTAPPRTPA